VEDAPDRGRKKQEQAEARKRSDAETLQTEHAWGERERGADPERAARNIADREAAGPRPRGEQKHVTDQEQQAGRNRPSRDLRRKRAEETLVALRDGKRIAHQQQAAWKRESEGGEPGAPIFPEAGLTENGKADDFERGATGCSAGFGEIAEDCFA